MENKHHYREASKSDHLAKEDLIGLQSPIIMHIEHCEWFNQRKISGTKKQNCIVAFFSDKSLKPWVINQTNCKMISKEVGSQYVEDWSNFNMEFYVDHNVKMMGEVVGGIKIRPCEKFEEMLPTHRDWSLAIDKVRGGFSKKNIEQYYTITDENYNMLLAQSKES